MRALVFLVVALTAPLASAQQEEPAAEETPVDEPPVDETAPDWTVSSFEADKSRVAGSAHRMKEKELERFEDDNIHRVLTRVPGVYVRGEDGYGLRPNIGLRGATSDRSSKVTLMEDGVLFAPAPYSAPAAYYFPLTTRMTSIEVFKGPSAIRHGPNTIGGAINMTTRPIGYGHRFGADLALGGEFYGKGHGHYGYGTEHWGVLVEAVKWRSDGFKELDSPIGQDTGFDKTELMLKARVNTDPNADVYHEARIKLGYSRELSNETYLGLTDADFAENPVRRYAASALDQMQWNRFALQLGHSVAVDGDQFRLNTVAYRHDFNRDWFRLTGIENSVPLEQILADPTAGRAVLLELLRGRDSGTFDPALLVTSNDRTFVSQGIQSNGSVRLPRLWKIDQTLQFGARFHHDTVHRVHTLHSFLMRDGRPIPDGRPPAPNRNDVADAYALSSYLIDEIEIWRFLISPGIRVEYVASEFDDARGVRHILGDQHAILPGVGVLFQAVDELSFLAGVHHGFSPAAPGERVEPESARNFEVGARLGNNDNIGAEVIGFYSDYDQLTPNCGENAGCDAGTQIDAGEALVYGLEVAAFADIRTPIDLTIPINVALHAHANRASDGVYLRESGVHGSRAW